MLQSVPPVLVPHRMGEGGVGVGPAGREEREQLEPVTTLGQVEVGHEGGRLVARRLYEHPAVGVGDERGAVEGDEPLRAVAVGDDDEESVGDRVPDDRVLPERLGVEVGVVRLRADGRRVHEHLGPGEAVRAGDLGEPLVPAGRHPEVAGGRESGQLVRPGRRRRRARRKYLSS